MVGHMQCNSSLCVSKLTKVLHLSVRGMMTHVPGPNAVSLSRQPFWKAVLSKTRQWIFSWMRPGYVETDEEYKISKLILLQFVCSASVLRAADGNVHLVVSLLRFLQTYIFVHETQYLHYKRSKVRHFDVSHGSHHEVSIHFFSQHCVTC